MNPLRRSLPLLLIIGAALLLIAPTALNAQYAINTVAGGGPNGLPALSSSIGYSSSVARDASGNSYVADVNSSRILKIDTTGTVTVFAGNGSGVGGEGGYSGDGGPATSAQLGRPQAIALDTSGNLFIADTENSVIREVAAATGTITTVAGTYYPPNAACNYSGDGAPAISAQLCRPAGLSVDSSGNIFIADTENSVIRCVVTVAGGCFGSTLAVGSITTVAGDANLSPGYSGDAAAATSAQLNLPNGVFVDAAGNIFIADTYNSVIRCVVGVAGGCFGSTLAVGSITTVAGTYYDFTSSTPPACQFSGDGAAATSAQLCLPSAVFLDASGNMFIADTENSVIREVSAGIIQTIAGTPGTTGYSGDGAAATTAELYYPNSLFVDSSENVFIADTNNFVIRQVSAATIQTVVGNHTIAYSGDGGPATSASLYASGGVFIDASGNIFIADTYNSVIREVLAATGEIQTVAGNADLGAGYSGDGATATSAQLNFPQAVFVDTQEDIFIADTENSRIRCVVGTAGGCFGSALAVGSITTVVGTGTAGSAGDGSAASSAELQNPYGVFADAAGNLFIADTDNSKIRCVVATSSGCFGSTLAVGSITTVVGTATHCQPAGSTCGDGAAAASAQLNFPVGIFVDSSGDLFIADTFDSKIREVSAADGNIQTVAGSTAPGYSGDGGLATNAALDQPYGVFVDSFGNIFIADTDNSALREVVAVTGNIQTIAGNGTEGFSGDGGTATSGQLAHPLGVAGDALGDLYVADAENSRIRELTSTVSVASIPTSATLPTGGSQQFAATVTGAADTSVTWQVNGMTGGNSAVGTISNLGSYQAPVAVPSPATVTVTAVANANGTTSAQAPVTMVSGSTTVTLTISTSPAISVVYTGTTQTFVTNVTDTTNTAVNWQVNGVLGGNATLGTISTAGVYSAPTTVPTPSTVVIGAVLQANSSVTASYPIAIVNAPTAAPPASQTASAGGSATYSLSLNSKTGDSKQALTLSCLKSSLPPGATCTFSPPTIVPGSSAVPFSLTITLPLCAASLQQPDHRFTAPRFYASLLPMAILLLLALGKRKERRLCLLVLLLLCAPTALLIGCGGGAGSSGASCASITGVYNVVVQGTTPAQPNPVTITTVTLTVK